MSHLGPIRGHEKLLGVKTNLDEEAYTTILDRLEEREWHIVEDTDSNEEEKCVFYILSEAV